MRKTPLVLAWSKTFPLMGAALLTWPLGLQAQTASSDPTESNNPPVKSLGVVTITGRQPTSLPTHIPTTMEGVTRSEIDRTINATDSEDALKYFPSLLVRKRYIGDYNHAILSSRASGTGNSARSAVYADNVLLSNYLGNGVGGLSFPPRWGLVSPSEIERVDVMYGPFSAAYPGNSMGAVVVYTTRMPKTWEVHAKVGYASQDFDLYNTHANFRAWETHLSVGNKSGDWSWLLGLNHADSHGQPLTFATRLLSSGTTAGSATPVSGAVLGADNANRPWYVLGTGTEYTTRQDQLKAKLAYDITPTLRANYTLGVWRNSSQGRPQSYLKNADGQAVYSGTVNIGGLNFPALTGADFTLTNESLTHVMHSLSLKQHTRGTWDWDVSVSAYNYQQDDKRQNGAGTTLPTAATSGAGTLADGHGTGWVNLAAKLIWRPDGVDGAHLVDFGAQHDRYVLKYDTFNVVGAWLNGPAGGLASSVGGRSELSSAYAQDTWALAPDWKAVLGLRAEQWKAHGGHTAFSASSRNDYASRTESHFSPKAALSFRAPSDWVLKASVGRALRLPTVSELYGATSTTNSQFINDPNLRPERAWTGELTAEKEFANALWRTTLFAENVHDSLYSQTIFDTVANRNISRVQNVGRIQTQGVEVAYSGQNVFKPGLDMNASLTYTDSTIKENAGFVVVPGDTIGKRQPNIARWRATALVSYRIDPQWTAAFGARYAGPQFRTLNNADVNGYTYQGVTKYFTTDVRVRYQINKQWSAAVGIDNLNNYQYWNFHPYPQRSIHAELKFDL